MQNSFFKNKTATFVERLTINQAITRSVLLLSFLLCFSFLKSQPLLTLDQAKKITLTNNFAIAEAKNNLEIAQNLTQKSANGYLPSVTAIGGLKSNLGGSSQTFNSGTEITTSNAFTLGGNAAVKADYSLFDKNRKLTLDRLKKSATVSELQYRAVIEENLFRVCEAYFKVAELAENLEALRQASEVSRGQLRQARAGQKYGQGSKLKVLNARVNIRRDSVNLLREQAKLKNAKRDLNVLMGVRSKKDFLISDDSKFNKNLSEKTLLRKAKNNNLDLLIQRQNISVEQMGLQLIDAEKQPTVSAGASYDFNFSDNPSEAFITNSNTRGLAANLGLNWQIFDGSRKIRKQNARLNLANKNLQLERLEAELERDVSNAFLDYETAIFILKVEKSAVETAVENFNRTQTEFKYGRVSSLEFRQAQLDLLNARKSLNQAEFAAKMREAELLRLAGELPK